MDGYAFVWPQTIVFDSFGLVGSRLRVDIPNVKSVELYGSFVMVQSKSIISLFLVRGLMCRCGVSACRLFRKEMKRDVVVLPICVILLTKWC